MTPEHEAIILLRPLTTAIEFLARRVGEHAEEHAAQITAAAR
jgi:hypothetical protein